MAGTMRPPNPSTAPTHNVSMESGLDGQNNGMYRFSMMLHLPSQWSPA